MKRSLIVLALVLGAATGAWAQSELESRCPGTSIPPALEAQCRAGAIGLEESRAVIGLAFTGGNPVPGASSTLGLRLRALPRLSAALRFTAARINTDDFPDFDSDEFSSTPRAVNVDAAVGIFSGFSLLPTVGGFGSIDLLASYGRGSLSKGDGFADSPNSWAAGVRLGILRESFTAPGIAVSAMYRRFDDITFGSNTTTDVFYESRDNSVLSVRGTIGKRLLMLGATAGVGYDRYASDVTFTVRTAPGSTSFNEYNVNDLTDSRTMFFANLSWTMLILHVIGEAGVQSGEGSNYFGSLALRLSL